MKLGQIIVTEGKRGGVVSWIISKVTKSKYTHVFIVTGEDELTEAWFPRVRSKSLSERVEALREQNREVIILDFVELTDVERVLLANKARSYVGRFYDIGQSIAFLLRGRFWADGAGTLICSRLITASFTEGVGINLFPSEHVNKEFPVDHPRKQDILQGWTVPADLLHSVLRRV